MLHNLARSSVSGTVPVKEHWSPSIHGRTNYHNRNCRPLSPVCPLLPHLSYHWASSTAGNVLAVRLFLGPWQSQKSYSHCRSIFSSFAHPTHIFAFILLPFWMNKSNHSHNAGLLLTQQCLQASLQWLHWPWLSARLQKLNKWREVYAMTCPRTPFQWWQAVSSCAQIQS